MPGVLSRDRSRSRSPRPAIPVAHADVSMEASADQADVSKEDQVAQADGVSKQATSRLQYLNGGGWLSKQASSLKRSAQVVKGGVAMANAYCRGDEDQLAKSAGGVVKELDGVWLKFAQQLAGRPDLVPLPKMLAEFAALYSDNPSRPKNQIEMEAKSKLTKYKDLKIEKVVKAGSIGEVSVARVGEESYALKTARPDQHDLFVTDFIFMSGRSLKAFDLVFKIMASFGRDTSQPRQVLQSIMNWGSDEEFQDDTMAEFDLRVEGALMERALQWLQQAEEFFSHEKGFFQTPTVKEVSSDGSAMLMDFMPGITLLEKFPKDGSSDVEQIHKMSTAKSLVNLYLHGMGIAGLFHADLHPGNLLSDETHRLKLLDWGIIVEVPTKLRRVVCRFLRSLLPENRDRTTNQDLRMLFDELHCVTKDQSSDESSEDINYKQLANNFDLMALVKNAHICNDGHENPWESMRSKMKEDWSRLQTPRWMNLWLKAIGALVSTLVHLTVDANALEVHFGHALQQVSNHYDSVS